MSAKAGYLIDARLVERRRQYNFNDEGSKRMSGKTGIVGLSIFLLGVLFAAGCSSKPDNSDVNSATLAAINTKKNGGQVGASSPQYYQQLKSDPTATKIFKHGEANPSALSTGKMPPWLQKRNSQAGGGQ